MPGSSTSISSTEGKRGVGGGMGRREWGGLGEAKGWEGMGIR